MPKTKARPLAKPMTLEITLTRYAVDPVSGCWLWTSTINPKRYGVASIGGKQFYAHRLFYERHKGPIPKGLTLDHLCRVRHCINPEHLEPVPKGVNTMRGFSPHAKNARKETCLHGHPFDSKDRDGHRRCKTCARLRMRAIRARLPRSSKAEISARLSAARQRDPPEIRRARALYAASFRRNRKKGAL